MRTRYEKSIKSLLSNYLVFGDYSNLSSRSMKTFEHIENEIRKKQAELQRMIRNDPRFDTASFEYRNETSGLKITHKINTLVSIDEQDIISWRKSFEELSRICKWTEDIQLEVLNQIIDINLQYKIGEVSSADEILNKILKLKYNYHSAYKYQNKAAMINQNDYYTISAYLEDKE
ncbi:hypothetical protein DMUE_1068 [Dictyocoela muelleri]|nr:hypothetical protein DMUE_1068 [Dictyocoela muelleri]